MRHNPDSVVIVDEAYIDFAGKSALELIDRYENLLVVQTFQSQIHGRDADRICNRKSGADRISKRCQIFIQLLHNESGGSALRSAECEGGNVFSRMCRPDRRDKRMGKTRACRAGFTYTDSRANFLFVTHPEFEASELFEALKREKIYVRYWNSERIRQYLRITVGTRQEMESLLEF